MGQLPFACDTHSEDSSWEGIRTNLVGRYRWVIMFDQRPSPATCWLIEPLPHTHAGFRIMITDAGGPKTKSTERHLDLQG